MIEQILNQNTSKSKYKKSIFKGRIDALHGQVVIEYKRPNIVPNNKKFGKSTEIKNN